ncbi:hypothetical protein E0L36_17550, partial [Streptomyces sp. AJS327]|nr:hypothetical protein [Streptomyces sp. AJS327]
GLGSRVSGLGSRVECRGLGSRSRVTGLRSRASDLGSRITGLGLGSGLGVGAVLTPGWWCSSGGASHRAAGEARRLGLGGPLRVRDSRGYRASRRDLAVRAFPSGLSRQDLAVGNFPSDGWTFLAEALLAGALLAGALLSGWSRRWIAPSGGWSHPGGDPSGGVPSGGLSRRGGA